MNGRRYNEGLLAVLMLTTMLFATASAEGFDVELNPGLDAQMPLIQEEFAEKFLRLYMHSHVDK